MSSISNLSENNKFFLIVEMIWFFVACFLIIGEYNFLVANHPNQTGDFINIVAFLGFSVTSWGFIKSWQASTKSASIEGNLLASHLILAEAKEDFKDIFDDHLLGKINLFKDVPGNIHLLLSTPAYGYGVLGKESSLKLFNSIKFLNGESNIELILFSPDAHFNYWINLIFWSIVHEDNNQIGFLKDFAIQTYEMIDLLSLSNKKCSIWLRNDTTVRLFGYSFHSPKPNDSYFSNDFAYISLVDNISLYQNQFGSEFKARSLPIHFNQMKDFFIGKTSYFHRIKSCPYTSRRNNEAALNFGGQGHIQDKELVSLLKWDFILGRASTSFRQYEEYRSFEYECGLFIKNLQNEYPKKYKDIEPDDIYKNITINLLNFLKNIDVEYKIIETEKISKEHLEKIRGCLNVNLKGLDDFIEYFQVVKNNPSDIKWQELLWKILISGVGYSGYVTELDKINKQKSN